LLDKCIDEEKASEGGRRRWRMKEENYEKRCSRRKVLWEEKKEESGRVPSAAVASRDCHSFNRMA
jgi:hypothetical protein